MPFFDPAAAEFYPRWDQVAGELVAHLRSLAGSNPYDRGLTDVVGELSTRSPEFRQLWAAHNVRWHASGVEHLRHPIVGEMELTYESMGMQADSDLALSIFTAEPGSASEDALRILAS
ncbi:hypothetical protein LRS13_20425 [Svornostia abyssi]|uniref:MmyB-like transcription regulator ligand binding domain-containing protein n=1 Tax=Svornostia abyssi TaxID=2898438 RepID=A0ABY5PP51_9ACTN|nr:hypothetical protein LRS13_20425 [Parviterribacteraceae bacterium J379]